MRTTLTLLLGLALVAACSGGESPAAPPRVNAILITPGLATMTAAGATQQFTAQPVDEKGGALAGVTVTWRSSNTSVVQVDAVLGLATAVAEGNAIVIAESGSASGQASVTVDLVDCTEPMDVALNPGQTLVTDPPASSVCALRLPSGAAGDRYRVAIVRLSAAQAATAPTATLTLTPRGPVTATAVQLRAPALPPLLDAQHMALLESSARIANATAQAHERLREGEQELLRRLGPLATPFQSVLAPAGPFPVAPPKKSFFARASDDTSCALEGRTPVTGLLVGESNNIAVYQDSIQAKSPSQSVSEENVAQMLDFFEAFGEATIEAYFGAIPDRDGNGQVVVLVTPEVSGNVAAFVWGGDLLTAGACAASNQMELVYFNGGLINALSSSPANYQALETLVHEVKHVVSFNQRLTGTLFNLHPSWMEEGTAEVASEIASRKAWAAAGGPSQNEVVTRQSFPASGKLTTPENYGVYLRLKRTEDYLSTQPNALVFAPPSGAYLVYGSGWHFHRFLGDAYGAAASAPDGDGAFFKTQTSSATPSGLPGLLTLTGKPIEALLPEYAAAVMLNGTGAPTPSLAFTTYDFPSAATVLPGGPDVPYPYPVTAVDSNPSASFSFGSWSGPLGNAGLRIHDFVSNGTGDGADITVQVEGPAKVVVVRVR